MTKTLANRFIWMMAIVSISCMSRGQDIPAIVGPTSYQGFSLPDGQGMLTYAVTASQSARLGYYGGNLYSTSLSGDLAYNSASVTSPFNATYAGGFYYTAGGAGRNQPSRFFQNLSLAKTLLIGRWTINVADSVRYLPDSPSSGFSGVPGVGDVGVTPVNPDPDQGILSNYSTRVTNALSGGVSRSITGRTSINGSGSYTIQRFVGDGNGLETNQQTGSGGINHRIDALSSWNLNYSYSSFDYPGSANNFSFVTQSLQVGYKKDFSRKFSGDVAVGPQRSGNESSTGRPPQFSASGHASVVYANEHDSYTVAYSRGVRNGSGVTQGTFSDSVTANYSRTLSRVSSVSLVGSYNRNTSLTALTTVPFATDTVNVSAQGSRSIGRFLSAYLSYSLLKQSLGGSAQSTNAYSGLSNVIAGGITYSPRPIHLGHQ